MSVLVEFIVYGNLFHRILYKLNNFLEKAQYGFKKKVKRLHFGYLRYLLN